jgi:ADP-ribose pyrophosphatase
MSATEPTSPLALGGRIAPPFSGPRRGWADRPPVLVPEARRPVHKGRIVDLTMDQVRFPDGSSGELEFIRHRGAAAIVPFLDPPEAPDPRILLVHQFRYAAGGDLYEVPAGMPDDPSEPWDQVAARELEEETGFRAGRLDYLSRIYTTPGFCDEVIHLFAATELSPGAVDRDGDEFMEVVPLRMSEVLDAIRSGEIVDGKTISSVLFAHAFLPSIRAETRIPPAR